MSRCPPVSLQKRGTRMIISTVDTQLWAKNAFVSFSFKDNLLPKQHLLVHNVRREAF